MAIFDSIGAPQFGLNDVKVAAWIATDSYGTAIDVPSAQMMSTTMRIISAELEGDDKITASGSRAIGAQAQIRFGSVSLAVLEVILGIASTPSGTPVIQDHLKVAGGTSMPYFGLCGKLNAEEGDGDLHVFLPKCKIMSDVQLVPAEYGKFSVSELTVMCVPDATYEIVNLIEHSTDVAIAIPPTNIS